MNFISLLENRKDYLSEINKFDFHPDYCQKSNLVWNTLFRLSLNKEDNFFLELPRDIVIHISKFSLGINVGEYQYYLNSLHSMIDNILFYARNGNRRGFNLCHQQIENLLNTLKSKIGQDVETSGLKRYINLQLERINICPLEEQKYIKLRIDSDLRKTMEYAMSGNERMTNFYKKKAEQFMIEFDSSQLSTLDKIEINKEKIFSFKKKDISFNLRKAKKYASLGDRNTFNFYKSKLLEKENEPDENILHQIFEIEKILTPFIENQFLTNRIFKYLKYAEEKAKLRDQTRMERYLSHSDRYYQRLISLSIEHKKNLKIDSRIELIHQIFNSPI